jgi:hypothetical protein
VPAPNEVSNDFNVLATNMGLAGITMFLIFVSATMFNKTVDENKDEVDAIVASFTSPFRALGNGLQGLGESLPFLRTVGWPIAVLGLTVIVYGFLEPGFGFNEKSLIVIGSLLIAAGLITYLTEGTETLYANRRYGQHAAVRIFPLAIVIAAVSVVVSRLSSIEPGVIYGFVGLAVFLRPSTMTDDEEAHTVFLPSLLLLVTSVIAWLAITPLRDALNEGNGSFLIAFFEGVAVAIFIGGLEGLFFNLLPISFMDGEKIWRWNKVIWVLSMGIVTLLAWHVLLNDQREYFDSLQETTPLAALIVGGVCVALTVTTWAYFRLRQRPG